MPGHNKIECPTTGGDGGKARRKAKWEERNNTEEPLFDDLTQAGKKQFGDPVHDARAPKEGSSVLAGGGKVGSGGKAGVYDPTLERPSSKKKKLPPGPPPSVDARPLPQSAQDNRSRSPELRRDEKRDERRDERRDSRRDERRRSRSRSR